MVAGIDASHRLRRPSCPFVLNVPPEVSVMNSVRCNRRLSRELLTKLATGADIASAHVSESRTRAERLTKKLFRPLRFDELHRSTVI